MGKCLGSLGKIIFAQRSRWFDFIQRGVVVIVIFSFAGISDGVVLSHFEGYHPFVETKENTSSKPAGINGDISSVGLQGNNSASETNPEFGSTTQGYRFDFSKTGNGTLGPFIVSRNTPTVDAMGTPVAPNTARYGKMRLIGPQQAWTTEVDFHQTWSMSATGYDRDNTQEIMCAVSTNLETLYIWEGDPLNTAYASLRTVVPILNTTHSPSNIMDIRMFDGTGDGVSAYTPHSLVVLPGCILVGCTRHTWSAGAWLADGIAVYALQHNGTQDAWALSQVGETTGAFQPGKKRGQEWMMPAYYPGAYIDPLMEAYIPITDYQFTSSSPVRGECYLIRASRTGGNEAWIFQWGLVYQDASDGPFGVNRHFHSAAWTPNGLIVAIGDTAPNSEVILFTPMTDWSLLTYSASSPLSLIRTNAFHGGDGLSSETIVGNQFAGACPGKDINTVLVGGDEANSLLYEITITSSSVTDGALFKSVYGYQPEHNGRVQHHISLMLKRPSPEKSTRVISTGYIGRFGDPRYRRLLYSPDAENFFNVARVPAKHLTSSPFDIYHSKIISLENAASDPGSPRGLLSMPLPTVSLQRAIQVSPGAINKLQTSNGVLQGLKQFSTNTFSSVKDNTTIGFGPVIEAIADGSSIALGGFRPIGSNTWDDAGVTHFYFVFYTKLLSKAGMKLRVFMHDSPNRGSNFDIQTIALNTRGEWQRHVMVFDTAVVGPVGEYIPEISFEQTAGSPYTQTLRFQMEGVYWGGLPPYPIAPSDGVDTTGAAEQVTIPLPHMTTPWSVAMSFTLPESGRDWHGNIPKKPAATHGYELATLWSDAVHYIEIKYDQDSITPGIVFTIRGGTGGLRAFRIANSVFSLIRGAQCDIMISYDGSILRATVISAGQDGVMDLTGAAETHKLETPKEIRIGNHDFSTIPDIEVNGVATDVMVALATLGQQNAPLFIRDCNKNGIDDKRDIQSGASLDVNSSGTPDECECLADIAPVDVGRTRGNGIVNIDDLVKVLDSIGLFSQLGQPRNIGDIDYNRVVNIDDLMAVLNSFGGCP